MSTLPVPQQLNEWGKARTPFVFLIDFEGQKPKCWKLSEPLTDFIYNFQGFTNITPPAQGRVARNTLFSKNPISFGEYEAKFNYVVQEMERGNSYLVNLTAETRTDLLYPLDQIAAHSVSKYVCCLKDEFVCFSPETFIQIHDGQIFTFPMKGTIDATIPHARELLLNDPKEIAEHATIVDLLRNDLSKVAARVRVTQFRYYEEIQAGEKRIGQVSSQILGELPPNYQDFIGDILFELLPAGSVSGAPKQKTKEIIFQAEQKKRGYFTGVAGYFDGARLDSCVLIRYLQADGVYRSGGGITAQSVAEKEYEELINKVYVPVF